MVVKFAAINLVIGLSTMFVNVGIRIDNFAHIGGFLCGLALGVPLVPRMTAGRERYLGRQKVTFAVACLVLALFGYCDRQPVVRQLSVALSLSAIIISGHRLGSRCSQRATEN